MKITITKKGNKYIAECSDKNTGQLKAEGKSSFEALVNISHLIFIVCDADKHSAVADTMPMKFFLPFTKR